MNQTIQELYERKSVRAYEERPIEPEKKEMVIQAAIQAPSAGNMTLYSIIDVTDQKLKDTLEMCIRDREIPVGKNVSYNCSKERSRAIHICKSPRIRL